MNRAFCLLLAAACVFAQSEDAGFEPVRDTPDLSSRPGTASSRPARRWPPRRREDPRSGRKCHRCRDCGKCCARAGGADQERNGRRSVRHRVRGEDRQALRPQFERLGTAGTNTGEFLRSQGRENDAAERDLVRHGARARWPAGMLCTSASGGRNGRTCSRLRSFYASEGFPVTELIGSSWGSSRRRVTAHVCTPTPQKLYLPAESAPSRANCSAIPISRARSAPSRPRAEAPSIGCDRKEDFAISKELGGTFTAADLAEFQPEWVTPISTDYRGWTVTELPPNGWESRRS